MRLLFEGFSNSIGDFIQPPRVFLKTIIRYRILLSLIGGIDVIFSEFLEYYVNLVVRSRGMISGIIKELELEEFLADNNGRANFFFFNLLIQYQN